MKFLIVPIEELKEFDPEWEFRRRSNDGTKAIIHQEIVDRLIPPVMTLEMNAETDENGNPIPQERTYPYPLVEGDELDTMEEFKPKDIEEPKPEKTNTGK